jgi:hypothetical protein
MSFMRWGLAPILALATVGSAQAGDLDRRMAQQTAPNLFSVGESDLDLSDPDPLDAVPLADLGNVADFHPETDRWTERNNRIRLTGWVGAWLFSGELDIHGDVAVGFRINWEVPGFIGIRWDSGFVPWSRLEIRNPADSSNKRSINGYVHSHTIGLGIFNPELSVDGLAFWAGFGGGLWFYNYNENDIFGEGSNQGIDGEFNDVNVSGYLFVELDYEVADVFHIGLGIRQHLLLAAHTDEGRFYEIDGQEQSRGDGRNDGPIDDLAGVTEITLNLSILF